MKPPSILLDDKIDKLDKKLDASLAQRGGNPGAGLTVSQVAFARGQLFTSQTLKGTDR